MNAHKRQLVKAILDTLSELDGGLMTEALLHGNVEASTIPPATLSDFEERLAHCQAQKWIVGIDDRFGRRKWAITDAGELARRELSQ